MRNDSKVRYREIKFSVYKPRAMDLLFDKILEKKNGTDRMIVYSSAIKEIS